MIYVAECSIERATRKTHDEKRKRVNRMEQFSVMCAGSCSGAGVDWLSTPTDLQGARVT